MNDNLKKKLIYRSRYRGSREGDLLLADSVPTIVDYLSAEELQLLECFLDESDMDILDWLTEKSPYPKKYQSIVQKLIS